MRNARFAAVAAVLLAAPAAVMAEGLSYTYVDLRYFSTDSDAVTVNQRGGALSGSLALGPIFFVAADASYGVSEDFSVGTSEGSFESFAGSVRLGAHHAITPALDIVASGGALFADIAGKGAFDGQSDDDIGYLANAGLRLQVIENAELGVSYVYQSVFDSDSSGFTADLQYHFTDHVSVVGNATHGLSTDFYGIGARYRF